MKKMILSALIVTTVGVQETLAQKKEFKEEIKKEFTFTDQAEDRVVVVKNIFGSVRVEGYGGDKVLVEVEKSIFADNAADLELGKEELKVRFLERGSKVIIHPEAPYIQFNEGKLSFNWCQDEYKEPAYRHHLDFTVKLPENMGLEVSTVNDGEVVISNTRGNYLKANNINGGIALNNVTGKTEVHCINGEVKISYAKNPIAPSTYYSLNGDINISYREGLSAEIGFKSMNGELYTDFDIARQFTRTSKDRSDKNGRFKFEARPMVQIGDGGLSHNFETLNGDVIIKKI